MFERQRLLLLPELAVERLLHLRHVDPEQVREHAVVDHVAHETPQLARRDTRPRRSCRTAPGRRSGRSGARRASSARRRRPRRRPRASARLPSPSRDSAQRRGRFPSCGRCSRACWRGWCTTSAGPRCSTGTGSCPTPGSPIWKMERIRIRLAVWLPEPLTVATWMLKSLTARCRAGASARGVAREICRCHCVRS